MKPKQKSVIAYHFTNEKLRDGSPIPKRGVWLKHKGSAVPCKSGLHASIHPFDALQYSPGNMLHLVEVRGDIQKHNDDKIVARERKIIKTINAEKLMRDFARWNVLRVLHLWPNLPEVVVKFLKTGDENLRDAARDAARDAVMAAAWSAARAAAWSAARDAARDAAWSAARDAARAAAWSAARDAAWSAAWSAARDAARDAFIKKSRHKFAQMVNAEFKKTK